MQHLVSIVLGADTGQGIVSCGALGQCQYSPFSPVKGQRCPSLPGLVGSFEFMLVTLPGK